MIEIPLITVILPCYNASEYLHEALTSIVNQTYTNLEILCIDDGSTDDTVNILSSYEKEDNRIKIIRNEKNLKLIKTLNRGIELAKGDFIARMDADDISELNRIELLYQALLSKKVDIVSCNFKFIDKNGAFYKSNFLKTITQKEIFLASFFFTPIGHAMLLGKTDVFRKNLYSINVNSIHTEDYELWTRMLRNQVSFYNLNKPLYQIRINTESVSYKFESLQKQNFAICAKNHYERYFNKTVNQEIYNIVVNRFDKINAKNLNRAFALIEDIEQSIHNDSHIICELQRLDILIQAFRKGSISLKLKAGMFLMSICLRNMFNSEFRKYLKTKF
jgi:glycosyltransferase involved in cell wall biosynthesis